MPPPTKKQKLMDGYVRVGEENDDDDMLRHALAEAASLSQATIVQATDMVRRASTCALGARKWNEQHPDTPLSERSMQRYLAHYKATGEYYVPGGRGPKELLTDDKVKIKGAFDGIRAAGVPVCSSVFASIAAGVVARSRPAMATDEGRRVACFSNSWARGEMMRMGIRCRKGTTSRLVAPAKIKTDGIAFDEACRAAGVQDKGLLLNFDEFNVKLGSQLQWTWERIPKGGKASIAIRDDRIGFTAGVLSCADGSAPALQIIWKGKTDRAHAEPPAPSSTHAADLMHQYHSEKSHFQTEDTFYSFAEDVIIPFVNSRRGDESEPAAIILDAAPQHNKRRGKDTPAERECDGDRLPPGSDACVPTCRPICHQRVETACRAGVAYAHSDDVPDQ